MFSIKDKRQDILDSQSKFQLLEYQTSLLNSMFYLYFREKRLWLGGGEKNGWVGGPPWRLGDFGPPQLYS
jgi:hypothetical protein